MRRIKVPNRLKYLNDIRFWFDFIPMLIMTSINLSFRSGPNDIVHYLINH